MEKNKLTSFINRMNRIGIDIELFSNIPWIYINSINGKRVTETFEANHGFTIAFLPVRVDQELAFTDITEIFKLIRKYITEDKNN
jgi:hypothetical protein